MTTVLITGSSGFTGRYMQALLEKNGFSVVGLACDLLDIDAVKQAVLHIQPTYVVHLAAISFVAEQDQLAFYHVNVLGTQNLLEALSALPVPPEKILIPSSANIYGAAVQDSIHESLCPAPINHYGMSKLAMEHMARTWFDRLPIILTRPFNYTGPGQATHFLVPKIVSHFQRQASEIELGNIAVSRDFLDVRDVAQIYLDLLQSKAQAETINICSGQAIALQEIIAQMNKIAGYEIHIKTNPAFMRDNEIKCLVGDNTRLKKLLTWTPTFSFEKTLRDMYSEPLSRHCE